MNINEGSNSSTGSGTCERVMNRLESVYLGYGKVIVETVTVVEFGMNNGHSYGTDGLFGVAS